MDAKKNIFEYLYKYPPTDMERKILLAAADYKAFASREEKLLKLELYFPDIIDKDYIRIIERNIKKSYNLNGVNIVTKYPEEKFDEEYFDQIIKEAKKFSANVYFLNGASYVFEGNKIYIRLAFGGGDYLENAAQFFKLIRNIIFSEFGRVIEIIIENGHIDPDNALYAEKDRRFFTQYKNTMAAESKIVGSSAQPVQSDSMSNGIKTLKKADPAAKPIFSDGMHDYDPENKTSKLGYIEFSLESIKEVYGEEFEFNYSELLPLYKIQKNDFVTTCGKVFSVLSKEIRRTKKKSLSVSITTYDHSMEIRFAEEAEIIDGVEKKLKEGMYVIVQGETALDEFDGELVITPQYIGVIGEAAKKDAAEIPRVELHLHTQMSNMDSNVAPEDIVDYAIQLGHRAIAVTDHGNVQAFPRVMERVEKLKSDMKVIYGIEAYFVNDSKGLLFGKSDADFYADTFVVFDIETTGLSPEDSGITEIGAVKILNGEVVDYFNTLVNPQMPIPAKITELTGIDGEMVKDAPLCKDALKEFLKFAEKNILIAHNASFDMGFIRKYCNKYKLSFKNAHIDTLAMSRSLNTELRNHKLDTLVKYYRLGDFNHHRASDDAEILARVFYKMCDRLKDAGITTFAGISEHASGAKVDSNHMIILVKNNTGLKNLYKMVSASYIEYYYKRPRIPKSLLESHREGLIIGSACEAGELYRAVLEGKNEQELIKIATFYDYLEVQPLKNNEFLISSGQVKDIEEIKNINKKIIKLGERINRPVVATGDVHFMRSYDGLSRKILLHGMKFTDADRNIPLYYRTTEEMLEEFSYLPPEKAYELVVENTNKIADMIEYVRPIPKGTYTPKIEGAEEKLEKVCYENAAKLYKNPIPELVKNRLDRELTAIIKHGFAVMYIIARELILKSEDLGYLVGSRGSVGSSFVATLAGISEVNPLPPHYYCKTPDCVYNEFITDGSYGSGFDLPDQKCPKCGAELGRDGQDIPFETFLGFNGEKAPDIDLNFSGNIQLDAHKYTEVLFGAENVFRAGTIGALANKTAYGFVANYLEARNLSVNKAHTDYLVKSCVGVKKTTGQHPGGIIVVPREYEIYDFTPVQHPADDVKSGVITTHFAFEFLHDTILKLDLLGHDVPTKYKVLEKWTGIDVRDLPLNDRKVMDLFSSTQSIGVLPEDIGTEVATFGIPEMGTKLVRSMLIETKPKTFAELLQISGFSHGEGIWRGNAQDLIKNGVCTLAEAIGLRDNIMLYLIHKGLDSGIAFQITEAVRKPDRTLTPEYEAVMREHNVPEWYIASCKKIVYMFPKAHASAYIIAALRLGWFKVYEPLAFYASYFSVQPEGFDAELVLGGIGKVRNFIEETEKKGNEATQKESEMAACMQVALEMLCRGLKFLPVDIYKSDSSEYKIEDGAIRLPFSSISGVGENAAANICSVRDGYGGDIFSVEEFKTRAKLTKTVVETLRKNKVFGNIPESDQLSLL